MQADRDPLPDDVLSTNLGLDIVVAITKTDFMSSLEKEFDYKEEHFDFIQQAIRKFCLRCKYWRREVSSLLALMKPTQTCNEASTDMTNVPDSLSPLCALVCPPPLTPLASLDGAALMYVSAKINKNCDLLYKYLVHRIFGLKFKTPALVVEKDAVFM